ncbi:hypothetical protein BDL97_01G090100 [Sphagnum fallax]|nr:hypothetical protein BDL97_01G090100 [Sphagnum fallax]
MKVLEQSLPQKSLFKLPQKFVPTMNVVLDRRLILQPNRVRLKKAYLTPLLPSLLLPNKSDSDKHIITNRVKCTISHLRPTIHIGVKIQHASLISPQAFYSLRLNEAS